jgi:AbrB family looped-hinge helix DNA binding protein
METATISSKYQVVIPRAVRESLGVKPGQKVQVIPYDGRIELIPLRPVREMRGFLKGIDTSVPREEDRI